MRPDVSDATERLYALFPEFMRDADETDFTLLRFLSLLGDQVGDLETLIDRIDYLTPAEGGTGETSALVDPATADLAWLPWLAQLVGVSLPADVQGQAARDAVAGATAGFRVGTKGAIADAAQSALNGSRYVSVYDHSTSVVGDGGQWDVLIVTRATETPDVPAVLAAVVAQGAKPAGVTLHHRAYSATWAQVNAAYPTVGDLAGKRIVDIEETGL